MIARLVRWSVDHAGAVVAATIILLGIGVFYATQVKFDALPDLTSNQVQVLTRAPGLTPQEVEVRVTRPVEVAIGGMPGLASHRSMSRYGLSAVTAIFEDDVDPYLARQIVGERLAQVAGELPPGVDSPELGPMTGGLGEIHQFTVSSPNRSAAELLELVELRVVPLLGSISGVVEVNTWGGQVRTFDVVVDSGRLAARGLTLTRARDALRESVGRRAGAFLDRGTDQVLLRGLSQPTDPGHLSGFAVSSERQGVVRIGDVAEVREGARPRIGAATTDGRGETVYVMVQMLRGENALEVMGEIHAKMEQVRSALPSDVVVDVVYDRSELVEGTVRTVASNLGEGGILVVLVLLLMLGSLRAGLLVAMTIPLSMLGAATAMAVLDIPGNLMSLGAIDFGLLVDGSVVMAEHVFHALAAGAAGGVVTGISLKSRVRAATSEVASPVFFGVLIILLVYVPVLTLSGVDGKMFRPMALTVVFALASSLVLALTFVPAALSLILRGRTSVREPFLIRLLNRIYPPLVGTVSRRPIAVLIAAVALLLSGVAAYLDLGSELAPQLDEGDLVVQTTRRADISIHGAVSEATAMERLLMSEVPEIASISSRIGSPAVATDTMGIEQADVFVELHSPTKWRKGYDKERIVEDMAALLAEHDPNSEPAFTQPIQMRFNELVGGSPSDVAVSIYGADLGTLRRLAAELMAMLEGTTGISDVRIEAPPDVDLIEVVPDPLRAAQLSFTSAEVLDAVQMARVGVPLGSTYLGPLSIPIVMRVSGSTDAERLSTLALPTEAGNLVPLSRVANVNWKRTPSMITHEDGFRRLVVSFNVRGANLGTVVGAAKADVEAQLKLPDGYRLEWGGQFETLRAASRRLAFVFPMVLALILGLLFLSFGRVRPALVIFTHVPFASVGGLLILWIRDMPISLPAAVGFIALSGIAVLNGLVLLTKVRHNEDAGMSPGQAVLDAARSRARPVLMTALVAALGFVPMMLATGVGAEVQRPLATVVVGGLLSSTLLTLFILPTLYPWMAGRRAE